MTASTSARPGIAVPGLTVPGLLVPAAAPPPPAVKAFSAPSVTDPRDGIHTVTATITSAAAVTAAGTSVPGVS